MGVEPIRQNSFAGGLISPELFGRADLDKFHVGAKTILNFIPLPHGPVQSRPGSEYVAYTRQLKWRSAWEPLNPNFSSAKMIPFEFSEDDTYMLELGEHYMRVHREGVPVLESESYDLNAFATLGGDMKITLNSTPSPLYYHMDCIYITGCTGSAAALAYNDKYYYLGHYEDGMGETITSVSAAAAAVVTTSENHGYSSTETVYISEVPGTIGALVNGADHVVTYISPTTYSVPVNTTGLAGGLGGWCQRKIMAGVSNQTFALYDVFGDVIPYAAFAYDANSGDVQRVFELHGYRPLDEDDIRYNIEHLARLHWSQSADIMPVAHRSYAPRVITRSDHDDWAVEQITFLPFIDAPVMNAPPLGGTDTTITWYVTAIAEDSGEESLTSETQVGAGGDDGQTEDPTRFDVTIQWQKVEGANRYHVYRNDTSNQRAGFVGLLEHDSENDPATYEFKSFVGAAVTPDFTLGPPDSKIPFGEDGSDECPGTLVWHEQRLYWASTHARPTKCWGSMRGSYFNHNVSVPIYSGDAVSFILASRKENYIQNLASLQDLVAFTSAREFRVNGGGDDPIEPTAINSKPQMHKGSGWLPALEIDDGVLVAQQAGPTVRDFFYTYEKDGYAGMDLSVMVPTLLRGWSLVDWSYAAAPFSTIWMVRSDGKVVCLSYHKEHKVWAWSEHDFGGQVESVAAVREGAEHYVYMEVARIIDGQVVKFIERLHSRHFVDYDNVFDAKEAFCVDCGLSYAPVTLPDYPGEISPVWNDSLGETLLEWPAGTDPTAYFTGESAPGVGDGDVVDCTGWKGTGGTEGDGHAFPDTFNRQLRVLTCIGGGTRTMTFETLDHVELSTVYTKGSGTGPNWVITRAGVIRKCVQSVSGLEHLEGETVAILANGAPHPAVVVTSGVATLVRWASWIHVGLGYNCDFETLDAEVDPKRGSIGYARQALNEVAVRFRNTRGIRWGPDFDNLVDAPADHLQYDTPPELENGWKRGSDLPQQDGFEHSRLCVRQSDPLPMEIQAIVRMVNFGS